MNGLRLMAILVLGLVAAAATPGEAQMARSRGPTAADRLKAENRPFVAYTKDGKGIEFRTVDGGFRALTMREFEAYIHDQLSDKTMSEDTRGHGFQVEYTSADGKAYLWYPGNDLPVKGIWRTRIAHPFTSPADLERVEICYVYERSYNPLTGSQTGDEECSDAGAKVVGNNFSMQRRHGDVFNLSSGAVPYRLAKTERPAWPVKSAP